MKEKCKVWLIKLGNLYYTGGLHRFCLENDKIKSYEFCSDESVAYAFLTKQGAEYIANVTGGNVMEIELTGKELVKYQEKQENYVNSESILKKIWKEEFEKSCD